MSFAGGRLQIGVDIAEGKFKDGITNAMIEIGSFALEKNLKGLQLKESINAIDNAILQMTNKAFENSLEKAAGMPSSKNDQKRIEGGNDIKF